ncbi:hypothetical protein CLAFUW4_05815 [Fulvia fulva]|uniref:Uncharacterized protein n=1 Tax=Passalora fulva TaxID=5499 RepID=A0A9Q8P911_PASFU|nr:uncharacterized protein CLAFUR5_05956 [Fulvia fulva]KAK4623763.1 hypothetical protein CLAFUR4_05809 [Fulvia fulva]KAK4625790.1 hypothetical protein CLAFUR0_05820 [Fulvia fulva]UJO17789.1 hypothetical protein CLAFUR5_05956 [Fulvia fulva]WPV15561.1 hypothetical protein CLAFUW4_05815 [Fulvia fulva]WPV29640.1 hypothetical protein CLAFUW7_05813 [Fulvia fulva]
MEDITLHIRRDICKQRRDEDCHAHHPHIEACTASLRLAQNDTSIGHIYLNILHQAALVRIGPIRMWDECQIYDERHLGAKLDKVENYLANESFPPDRDLQIRQATCILFIDEVILHPTMRGQGRGLAAVKKVMDALELPDDTVVLLQAGPVGDTGDGRLDAGERIARHWKKLGFQEWSETDESWLCLLLREPEGRVQGG